MEHKVIRSCKECQRYKKAACEVRKLYGKEPGPNDWCHGYKKHLPGRP